MNGTLYLVATPIGNLKDITLRAVETLRNAEEIACEDTRRSLQLLNHLGISKPLFSVHKFNERESGCKVIEKLREGKSIAYISDAGMPCISDPGAELVRMCREEGLPYTVVPGANAALSALVLSGFSAERFLFVGFLPERTAERRALLEPLTHIQATLIFYVAPHNLNKDLDTLYRAFGDRRFAAVKEITKLHERVEISTLGSPDCAPAKGEYVVLVEGGRAEESPLNELELSEHIAYYERTGLSHMDAVKQVAKDRNLPKNQVYRAAIENRQGKESQ